MDREYIKKHKATFEAWLDGAKVEYTDGKDPWRLCRGEGNRPEWRNGNIYRIKPEVVHYNANMPFMAICGDPTAKKSSFEKEKVTCPDCLAILNCKYPNLRKAIQERKEFFVKVTPEQSKEVQEIAFGCEIEWLSGLKKVKNEDEYFLSFTRDYMDKYAMINCEESCSRPQFHLSTDSFNAPLPEWVKIGAACFRQGFNDVYFIREINGNIILVDNKEKKFSFSTPDCSILAPAIRHAPTCAELTKYMPLCLKLKGEGNLYRTVLSMNAKSVVILEKLSSGGCVEVKIADLHEKYTFADGSEIGEWRKA